MTKMAAITLYVTNYYSMTLGAQGESFKKHLSEDEVSEKPNFKVLGFTGRKLQCTDWKNPWLSLTSTYSASLVAQMVKNLPTMQETWVQSLGWADPPGEGNGYPLQYSCLENSMHRGVMENYSSWDLKESNTSEWLTQSAWNTRVLLTSYNSWLPTQSISLPALFLTKITLIG